MQIIVPVSDHIYIRENEMKFVRILFIMFLSMFIIANCTAVQTLPSTVSEQATTIASTVEAGIESAQTILTPPAVVTSTPEGVIDLTNMCIPPLTTSEVLTELTLKDGRRLVTTNGWLTVFKADGAIAITIQVPAELATPLADFEVPAEHEIPKADIQVMITTFRCEKTNVVYYDPDSVE